MDDFPDEKPGIAWTVYLVAIVGLIAVALMALLYLTPKAHAQEGKLCAPADGLFKRFASLVDERPIWEGSMKVPQGVLQFVLFQSEKGTWTLFVVQDGIACMRARGEAGTPNELGKGT